MVRFACRSKRIEDIRNAARVVSYMLEESNRHDQLVFTTNWILNGLDDKSVVYVVATRLLLYSIVQRPCAKYWKRSLESRLQSEDAGVDFAFGQA
jgi:hypothetical protein